MQVSVVIPVRGSACVLRTQLAALARQEYRGRWEVVIADNGADGLPSVVAAFADSLPGLRVVDASGRTGAAHARNVGVRRSSGDAVLFLDADDEVEPGYISAMADALAHHAVVAARVDHHALNPQWGGQPVYPPFQTVGLTRSPDGDLLAAGGTLGVRRAVFDQVGGWDQSLVGAEDDDFCRRLAAAGHALAFVPEAVVRYRTKDTIGGLVRQRMDWGYREARLLGRRRADARSRGARPLPRRRTASAAARAWGRLAVRSASVRSRADAAAALGALGREVGWAVGRFRRPGKESR